jgi:NAD(P)-dependent dehydrogenase (short-subunit alcohol dehydrogenase family)
LHERLAGKAIIVAGAGGIGGELARRYASEGAAVIVGDINTPAAQAVADEIQARGGRALGVELDGADEGSIRATVALAVTQFGSLDGFHANFASFKDGASGTNVLDIPLDIFDEVMRVNMRGFMLCTRAAIPAMQANGGGSIIYTSSAAAYLGQPVRVAYAMSKLAVHALMRHVATRFGPEGIRANAITPGIVTHPRFEATVAPEYAEEVRQKTPLGRLGRPQDAAAMAALLMSDEGNFITGQVISVDGGKTMRQ